MQIAFVLPSKRKQIKLGKVKPGTIVRFADSGKYVSGLSDAVANPKENLFVVFKDQKPTKGHTDLVSIDGQHMFRRTNDRMVVIHGTLGGNTHRNSTLSPKPVRISEVQPGELAALPRSGDIFMIAKGAPLSNEKVSVISIDGNRIFFDDDLLIHVFPDASINPEL